MLLFIAFGAHPASLSGTCGDPCLCGSRAGVCKFIGFGQNSAWLVLGALLGSPWADFGHPWALLGHPWDCPRAPLGLLGVPFGCPMSVVIRIHGSIVLHCMGESPCKPEPASHRSIPCLFKRSRSILGAHGTKSQNSAPEK